MYIMKRRKVFYVIGALLFAVGFTACKSATEKKESNPRTQIIGNAKDEHGCLTSAGYQWSALLKDCIRPFEKGIKLTGQKQEQATLAAYLVFNADSSKVEVFMPGKKVRPILTREQSSSQKNWKGDGTIVVSNQGRQWLITDGETLLFRNE